jgi:predicted dehydrogenase
MANTPDTPPSRRRFLSGTGLVLAPHSLKAGAVAAPSNVLNIAVVGCGVQGQSLLKTLSVIAREKAVPVRLAAVCDIWPFRLEQTLRRESWLYSGVNAYAELEDLLAKEKSLDAVFIATPDFLHAAQTTLCLKAGLHVYCETPMAHNGTDARTMVRTMRETGKLLQIGYQRRSNFNYRYTLEILQRKHNAFGRIVGAEARWHQTASPTRRIPPSAGITDGLLKRHGFEDLYQLRNWQWFKKYTVGPIGAFGAGQLDVFNWWLGRPRSIAVTGGIDAAKSRECYDNTISCITYAPPEGVVRTSHQMRTYTGDGTDVAETLIGEKGCITLAEQERLISAMKTHNFDREWESLYAKKLITEAAVFSFPTLWSARKEDLKRTSPLPVPPEQKLPNQAHIENFLRAVRGETGVTLRCDAATAFESEVPLYRVNEAGTVEKTLHFTDADFAV